MLQVALISVLCFQTNVDGSSHIQGDFGESKVVIRTTDRLAGAIDSLTWGGVEFIDSTDHGRQLQSASNFDVNGRFVPEAFNPTEAGSRRDGAGPNSSSRLLSLHAEDGVLTTRSQMAFWLRPGEATSGKLALNTTLLSNHLLTKRVQIGFRGLQNVIDYRVTFSVPAEEQHRYAQFEAVTGYMPSKFSRFLAYDKQTADVRSLTDGPGEQSSPVILSTPSGSHAMGVFSPDQPSAGFEEAGYGRFRFTQQKVVKWNCVFRQRASDGFLPAGDVSFQCFVVVGSLSDVVDAMTRLHDIYPTDKDPSCQTALQHG